MSRIRRTRHGDRGHLLAAVGVALASVAAVGVLTEPPPADAALANQVFDPTPRIHGPVTVLGDSVLQGSLIWGPTLVDRLAENGWGPIRARAGVGYSTGFSSAATEAKATFWIDRWRPEGWDAPAVFVVVK